MTSATTRPFRRALLAAGGMLLAGVLLAGTACGPDSGQSMSGHDSMPGMTRAGDGRSPSLDGYRFAIQSGTLPAGTATTVEFRILGPDGRPVTGFTSEQTRLLHFYAIRSDLTGFQHVHPTMAADGTWRADLAALAPGHWRLFTTFTPAGGKGRGRGFVLSQPATVPGTASPVPLPSAAPTTQVDGYTLTVTAEPMAGMAHPLTIGVSRGGQPVTDLQPYLGSYAHLTAFHAGDLAFAHLHPEGRTHGDHGGPTLSFHAELPTPGDWRLFIQFRTGGVLHTAAVTLHVS